MADFFDLLKPARLTSIVDVGASPVEGPPVYRAMLEEGLCTVIGFEPNPAAWEELNAKKRPMGEVYLPYAIGAIAGKRVMNTCKKSGMDSLLERDTAAQNAFESFAAWGTVTGKQEIHVVPLDIVEEITAMDMLCMDVQGCEVEVLHSAQQKLTGAVAVLTEVSWVPLYKEQAPFGVTDLVLRRAGFLPHCFVEAKLWPIHTLGGTIPGTPEPHQLLESDILYVRDFTRAMSPEQWKQLAMVAHYIAGSPDLAMRCVAFLETHGHLPPKSKEAYTRILEAM